MLRRPSGLSIALIAFPWTWACVFAGTSVPYKIVERGNQYLIQRAGKRFCERHITFDSTACDYSSGRSASLPARHFKDRSENDVEDNASKEADERADTTDAAAVP